MRVAIDVGPLAVNSAGVKTYLFHWLRALRQAAPAGFGVETYPFDPKDAELRHTASVLNRWETFRALLQLGRPGIWLRRLSGGWRLSADVFHASVLTFTPPRGPRLTTTLHDVTYRLLPHLHTAATLECHQRFDDQMLARAAGVLCVSESTRQDAIRHLGIAPERLHTVHPGIDPRFAAAGPAEVESARKALSLPASFVLFLATIEPRKNLDRLLDGYLALPASVRDGYPLIVAGGPGWKSEATLARLRSLAPQVRYLGYVDEVLLPGLTAAAAVFAYPSLYEGFGFPLAQAMAAGVACLTSNNSSMAEIAGGAAELVDPHSTHELSASLERLLTSEALRLDLARRGREQAARFTWEACGKKSIAFFQALDA